MSRRYYVNFLLDCGSMSDMFYIDILYFMVRENFDSRSCFFFKKYIYNRIQYMHTMNLTDISNSVRRALLQRSANEAHIG